MSEITLAFSDGKYLRQKRGGLSACSSNSDPSHGAFRFGGEDGKINTDLWRWVSLFFCWRRGNKVVHTFFSLLPPRRHFCLFVHICHYGFLPARRSEKGAPHSGEAARKKGDKNRDSSKRMAEQFTDDPTFVLILSSKKEQFVRHAVPNKNSRIIPLKDRARVC